MIEIREIQAKSILTKSELPDTDYVINPYTGCQFGCIYCYASFMGRFVGEPIENWGNYVYAKVNSVELLEREITKISAKPSRILLSSVTDPYQNCEKKYKLTQGILGVIAERSYPGLVSILTKSPLVMRDLGIIKKIKNCEVGMTITETEDKICKALELRAPSATSRINTLKKLNESGVRTFAFIGPLLPHLRYAPRALDALFKSISESGTESVYVEHINLKKVHSHQNTRRVCGRR